MSDINRKIHIGRQINPSQICANTNVFQSLWKTDDLENSVTFAAVTPSCCEQCNFLVGFNGSNLPVYTSVMIVMDITNILAVKAVSLSL